MSLFDAKTAQFSFTAEEPTSGFVRVPQQAWMAVLGEQSQSGLAFAMRYDELMSLYNCRLLTQRNGSTGRPASRREKCGRRILRSTPWPGSRVWITPLVHWRRWWSS